MIVDAHAHIYSPDEATYPPVAKPYRPPAGTGTPDHLKREAQAAGVDRVMMVQTSSFYGWDNRLIRDVAAAARDWAVGVCTLEPDHPHSPEVLYSLVQRSNVRALRTECAGPRRVVYDHQGNRRLYAAARELGVVINAMLSAESADQLARMLADFPRLPVVLDHCLGLSAGPSYNATMRAVIDLAQFANVYAKVDFLPTGSTEVYPFRDMHDVLHRIVDAYGPDRCVWGSSFPTELWCPKVTYASHLRLFQEELGFSTGEQAALLGD